ncbi:MAG: hypothetical protein ACREDL_25225, partial [Bradyrhizobium sp.]
MIGQILGLGLQFLTIGNLLLELLIGVDEAPRSLLDALFQVFVGLPKLIVCRDNLLLRAPSTDLGVHASQRDGKIDRLRYVIVGAKFKGIDNIG